MWLTKVSRRYTCWKGNEYFKVPTEKGTPMQGATVWCQTIFFPCTFSYKWDPFRLRYSRLWCLTKKLSVQHPNNTTIPTWPVSPATDSSDYLWMKYARNHDLKKRRNNTHGKCRITSPPKTPQLPKHRLLQGMHLQWPERQIGASQVVSQVSCWF